MKIQYKGIVLYRCMETEICQPIYAKIPKVNSTTESMEKQILKSQTILRKQRHIDWQNPSLAKGFWYKNKKKNPPSFWLLSKTVLNTFCSLGCTPVTHSEKEVGIRLLSPHHPVLLFSMLNCSVSRKIKPTKLWSGNPTHSVAVKR